MSRYAISLSELAKLVASAIDEYGPGTAIVIYSGAGDAILKPEVVESSEDDNDVLEFN